MPNLPSLPNNGKGIILFETGVNASVDEFLTEGVFSFWLHIFIQVCNILWITSIPYPFVFLLPPLPFLNGPPSTVALLPCPLLHSSASLFHLTFICERKRPMPVLPNWLLSLVIKTPSFAHLSCKCWNLVVYGWTRFNSINSPRTLFGFHYSGCL